MPNTNDVRKVVLEDARKPLYAVVGAGDLAVARTASQLRELPAETQSAVDTGVRQVRTRIEDLGSDVLTRIAALRTKAGTLQSRKPAELRSLLESYLDKAREVYDELAVRGEKVVGKVAERPGVKTVLGRAESLLDRAGDTVQAAAGGAAETVEETVEAATQPKPPTRRTTTRRAAAK